MTSEGGKGKNLRFMLQRFGDEVPVSHPAWPTVILWVAAGSFCNVVKRRLLRGEKGLEIERFRKSLDKGCTVCLPMGRRPFPPSFPLPRLNAKRPPACEGLDSFLFRFAAIANCLLTTCETTIVTIKIIFFERHTPNMPWNFGWDPLPRIAQ